jgi:hypothetical protein
MRDFGHSKKDLATLNKLLALFGFFGGHTVLPMIATYIDDPRIGIADTAYIAQQQILVVVQLLSFPF